MDTTAQDDRAVLVVGGGTMGAGIVQSFLQVGRRVRLSEPTAALLESARGRIEHGLERAGELEALARLETVVGLEHGDDVILAIEAVPEDVPLKHEVLGAIEALVPADAVVASNTSSLSITELAGALKDPGRFLGMHFFNPVPRSVLVEIVTGPATRPAVIEEVRRWIGVLGKEEIVVKDSPGFATSRLGIAIGLEAMRMVEEGVASPEDIDRGMVLGYRFPMGPLRLSDLVGLDVRLAVADHLASTLGDRLERAQLLRDKVAAGELGRKSGRGFFDWDDG